MDSVCEIIFLRAIEARKGVLVSKHMSKECREEKKKAWEEICAVIGSGISSLFHFHHILLVGYPGLGTIVPVSTFF